MRQRILSSLCLLLLTVTGSATSSAGPGTASAGLSLRRNANSTMRAELSNLNSQKIDRPTATIEPPLGLSNRAIPIQCSGRDDSASMIAAVTAAAGSWVVIAPGQTCAAGDISIPNLRIEKGGLLKPLNSHKITLADNFQAGDYQVFTNALAGQGTVTFLGSSSTGSINPLWWGANTTPGTTDFTAPIQAAINATGGRGKVHFPASTYRITETLTVPAYATGFSPLVLEGDGAFLSNLVNQASASKPTLLLNRQLVTVRNLGIWGTAGFPNDGMKISGAGRIYIDSCDIFVNGSGITLEQAQSVWITNNYGSVSSGAAVIPSGAGGGWTYAATDAFVKANIPAGGFANHIVIRDNMNEGYSYQVYTNQSGDGYGLSWTIEGNQGEGSNNGIYLKGVNNFKIADNYLSEGSTGYAVELDSCRYGSIGPNYLHFTSYTAKESTVKLTDVLSTTLSGQYHTVWLNGRTEGLVFTGGVIGVLIDESSDKLYSLFNVTSSAVGVPKSTFNMQLGNSEWRSSATSIIAYPGARLGDRIWKVTPTAGASPGWICTSAAATGALARVTGAGPDPVVLPDYYNSIAYDFRITITRAGAVGTAVYKIDYQPAGGKTYTNLVTNVTTTEVPRMINEVTGGVFTIKWPARNYALGNQWTLTAVAGPVWTPLN